jgi:nitroreductase
MNPTLEMIHKRRSIRLYDPTPLTDEEKGIILQAAMRAPTAGAMMLYTILEVEDQALKDRLAVTCDNKPFIAHRVPTEGDLILAMMDALIAAQTAALAAESLGIGSCYIGDIIENWETHREMFDLPQYTFPAVLLCLGRPADKPLKKRVPRFERQFIVHQDQYRRFSPEELAAMHLPFGCGSFSEREYPNGARNVVQFNYIRKFTAEFSREMTRSVRVMIRSWCGEEGEGQKGV